MQHLLRVVPVIGILNDKEAFKPAPNPAEVESVFDAPLEMFIKVFFSLVSLLSESTYVIAFVCFIDHCVSICFRMKTGGQRRESGWVTNT